MKDWFKEYVYDGGEKPSTPSPAQSAPAAQPVQTIPVNAAPTTFAAYKPTPFPTSAPASGVPDANLLTVFTGKLRDTLTASPFTSVISTFLETTESLADAIPEEGNRFRAALKLLKKQSNTEAAQLIGAYQGQLSTLDSEAQKFAAGMQNKKATEVDAREATVAQLNQQIASLTDQRDTVATETITAKQKLAGAQASFESAISALKTEITDALQKINIYVPTSTPTSAATK